MSKLVAFWFQMAEDAAEFIIQNLVVHHCFITVPACIALYLILASCPEILAQNQKNTEEVLQPCMWCTLELIVSNVRGYVPKMSTSSSIMMSP